MMGHLQEKEDGRLLEIHSACLVAGVEHGHAAPLQEVVEQVAHLQRATSCFGDGLQNVLGGSVYL